MLQKLRHPLAIFLLYGFFVLSLPFIQYPLTDGDITNWTPVAVEVTNTGDFLRGANDQGHGPLIVWGAVPFLWLSKSLYMLNMFNLLMGLLGIGLTYFFAKRLYKSDGAANLATFVFSTSLVFIYLSRTPMYDWPATILYYAFMGFYLLYVIDENPRYLGIAIVSAAVGSLSRFSICLGLSGIYIICITWIYRRSILLMIRDGLLLTGACVVANIPWFIGQMDAQGTSFLKTFVYDNTGRYVKSTRVDATFRADFYGFSLYVLAGALPYTFFLIGSFFNRTFFKRVKESTLFKALVAGFLPCLILFSFSGHTKLGRYIAYVFPPLLLLLSGFLYQFDLKDPAYRKKCARMVLYTAVFIVVVLVVYTIQFFNEVQTALPLVFGLIGLLLVLMGLAYFITLQHHDTLRDRAYRLLPGFLIAYSIFFSIVSFEMTRAPFLHDVHSKILKQLSK